MQGLIDRICARLDIDDFYWEKVPTPILDVVENPLCLKNLSLKVSCMLFKIFASSVCTCSLALSNSQNNSLQELKQLAVEIRLELCSIMSGTGISLKASMAVVELTVAMHHVFHAPVDKILWDVGDQVSFSFTCKISTAPFVV